VVGHRDAHDPPQDWTGDLHRAPLDGEDALEPPASRLGQRKQAHGLARRSGVDHDDVVLPAVVMLGDPEKARKLIHSRKDGELLGENVVEAAPLEDTLHISLDRSPVAPDAVVDVRLLTPEVIHNPCWLAPERNI